VIRGCSWAKLAQNIALAIAKDITSYCSLVLKVVIAASNGRGGLANLLNITYVKTPISNEKSSNCFNAYFIIIEANNE